MRDVSKSETESMTDVVPNPQADASCWCQQERQPHAETFQNQSIFTEASSVQVWPLAQGCRRCAMSSGRSDFVVQSEWFPRAQVGNHISARAQEHILSEASASDARVVLLESVYVIGRQF